MTVLLAVLPLPLTRIATSRGSGAANLGSRDPKEVWADDAVGPPATITIDFGTPVTIDTLFLGYLGNASADASWAITGGLAASAEFTIRSTTTLRVPDVASNFAARSHALWHGVAVTVRYLAISLVQPAGAAPLTAGVLVVGRAFTAGFGPEWGSGRQVIDTGTATPLSSGGFATVEGARKRLFTWTFGDLSSDEADRFELFALSLGQTTPGLVIEDADRSPGLAARIHYGLFIRWNAFERRNRRQTRWEVGIEEWV